MPLPEIGHLAALAGLHSEGASPAFTFDAGASVEELGADGLNILLGLNGSCGELSIRVRLATSWYGLHCCTPSSPARYDLTTCSGVCCAYGHQEEDVHCPLSAYRTKPAVLTFITARQSANLREPTPRSSGLNSGYQAVCHCLLAPGEVAILE